MAPTKEVDTVPTAIGKLLILAFGYEVPDDQKDQAENWSYGLFETVYPDQISSSSDSATLKRFWYGCENGAAQNVQGKILSDTVIQLNGYPGRAFRIDYQNGKAVITMRCYLVKHTMYMLQTITDSKKDYNSSMGRYMASFELDPNY